MTVRQEYQRRLGDRLRAIRTQQDLTLQQVEEKSDGTWKAVVIGAYERGDRAISAAKLADLARFYGVPVAELLPEPSGRARTQDAEREQKVKLDLTKLTEIDADLGFEPITRYASTIQLQRGDYNGRVLTLRGEDVRALAVVLGTTSDDLVERLGEEKVLVGA